MCIRDSLYSLYNYVASPTGVTTPAIQWVQEFITIDYTLKYDFPQNDGMLKGLKAQLNVYNICLLYTSRCV